MARFVPKEKMSKKARKEINRRRRVTWEFSPVTKTVGSKKVYNRKKNSCDRPEDYGAGVFQFHGTEDVCGRSRSLSLRLWKKSWMSRSYSVHNGSVWQTACLGQLFSSAARQATGEREPSISSRTSSSV